MVRSKSHTHSSRSRSRSQSSSRSRSRSRSRKKRYSSRSRSRSYSRSRSRERNYPRDYRRDYRMNRGMRRPYGFRTRGRGYYPGGGRFHHRGGFRPNWHNRRYSRSPRRGRSRSRTPKHRSVSQRSRSKSHHSGRSSPSRRSSSSSSSSHSHSPTASKRRGPQDKAGKKTELAKVDSRPVEVEKGEGRSDEQVVMSLAKSELKRPAALISESWIGISAYDDNSPHRSPSPVPTPPSQRSSRSDTLAQQLASKISPPAQLPIHSRPVQRSPEAAALGRYSPSHSPAHSSPGKSPGKVFPSATSSRGFFFNSDEQDLPKVGKFFKRYLDEGDGRMFLQEKVANVRDGEPQKERVQGKGDWESVELEVGVKKKTEKVPFLGDSPEVEEEDESQAYRQPYQFRLASQTEPTKNYPVDSHWNLESQEEGSKYKTKASKAGREFDRFGEDRTSKFKDPGFVLDRLNKDKYIEEGKGLEKNEGRLMGKREALSPLRLKADRLRELINQGPLLQKTVDTRDKGTLRDESPPRVKMIHNEGPRPEVKMKMAPLSFENTSPGTSVTSDRSLVSALVHSTKKEQGFRAIFDHIKRPQAFKSSAESYIHHVVALVHHVREHYFKSTGMSLHERFTVYQKAAVENEARHKSPEIHRRIDISPSAFKKARIMKEDFKGDKKTRCDSADLRHDIDRRRKERSRDRDDTRGSREPSPSRKMEKLGKEFKDYKDYKSVKDDSKHKTKERERSRSSSGSSPSREDKDRRRVREEDSKPHHEQKDYAGYQGGPRARGTFFRIRGGRGRGRGVFTGPNPGPSAPNIPFQKRPKEEEWDPEYTPKSRKYFLHDDRDDGIDYWAKRGRGRGVFQRGRGGRFPFKKSSSSPKWTHDKYQCDGNIEEDDEDNAETEETKDKHKEEKVE
ncbi:bcl-2-associated transcription factor 1-like isoform X2 [Megalops cyprinoides]|uniref:bcl-2-associated transcription factor 1-like isoform X2 n=1 Tax=Megalops cyprinoides TaxID=118141 RepID=UPI00186416D4|nr:bcl-2-associated transcription factor 1-like isoform X2 [Megalops cyprinoides]